MALLLYPTLSDICWRKFEIGPVMVMGILAAGICWVQGDASLFSILTGCFPGIVFWMIGVGTGGAVGFGDVIVILCLGMILGWQRCSWVCLTALFLAGMVGVILIAARKAGRKTELPFVPFLSAAFILMEIFYL